jgi:hypothetical protein
MKNLFKSILLATVLMFSGPIVNIAQANNAQIPAACAVTEDQFLGSAKNMNAKIMVASDAARAAIIDKINEARTKAGMWELEADSLMIGIIQDKGQILVGIVMYKNHCVVPGTVKVFPAQDFVGFLVELGLSMDDFKPIAGA